MANIDKSTQIDRQTLDKWFGFLVWWYDVILTP